MTRGKKNNTNKANPKPKPKTTKVKVKVKATRKRKPPTTAAAAPGPSAGPTVTPDQSTGPYPTVYCGTSPHEPTLGATNIQQQPEGMVLPLVPQVVLPVLAHCLPFPLVASPNPAYPRSLVVCRQPEVRLVTSSLIANKVPWTPAVFDDVSRTTRVIDPELMDNDKCQLVQHLALEVTLRYPAMPFLAWANDFPANVRRLLFLSIVEQPIPFVLKFFGSSGFIHDFSNRFHARAPMTSDYPIFIPLSPFKDYYLVILGLTITLLPPDSTLVVDPLTHTFEIHPVPGRIGSLWSPAALVEPFPFCTGTPTCGCRVAHTREFILWVAYIYGWAMAIRLGREYSYVRPPFQFALPVYQLPPVPGPMTSNAFPLSL